MDAARLPQPCLMLVTGPLQSEELTNVVREAVAGGVNVVQLRDRSATAAELSATVQRLAPLVADAMLLVNGCHSAAAEANGLHLAECGPPIQSARRALAPGSLVGRSVHSVAAAVCAEEEGADYLIAGTVFPSGSHPGEPAGGVELLRVICAAVRIPVIAIGGVTADNCASCVAAGAAGVAVLSAILHAADPRAAASRCWEELSAAWRDPMEVTVNGEVRTLEPPMSIAELLSAHDLNPQMVVVEHNRTIIARERFIDTPLRDGDEVEIVQMMAGG